MKQLDAFDASFLYMETPTMHAHVVGVLVLEPSGIVGGETYEAIRHQLEHRLGALPELRRR